MDNVQKEVRCTSPMGELALRTWCMPADTNPYGDIFGGWLMAQMDIAGAITANRVSGGRAVTIAVDKMEFHLPVGVGDVLCCYADVSRIGKSSITVKIEAWVTRKNTCDHIKVTEGIFTYVAVDEDGVKRVVPRIEE